MMRKKRGYKRDTPSELVRDYTLFAIACEGSKREPVYFKLFQQISPKKIQVDIIDTIISDIEMHGNSFEKSAPKWVLDRAVKYIEKEGLIEEDQLWFVMDVDRWSDEQLRIISEYCVQHQNWNIVLSNPCFEVWLYFHKKKNIASSKSHSCNDFKQELSTFDDGGYHPYKYIPHLLDAILNSKNTDSNPEHFKPEFKETKVYQLGEALMRVIGKKAFHEFNEKTLPNLIKTEVQRVKAIKTRKK